MLLEKQKNATDGVSLQFTDEEACLAGTIF